jgi:inner membrane protein
MTWRTHVMAGMASLWFLYPLPDALVAETIGPAVAAATLGSLLPDLDAAHSKLKHWQIGGVRPLWLMGELLYRQLGHRGLLHSLAGLAGVALIALPGVPWWGWAAAAGLILGYGSHLATDACTRSGIPLLYPRPQRRHLLPQGLRFVTGSQAEEVLFVLLSLPVLLLLLNLMLGAAD